MELMEQTIESPDLMAKLTEGLPTHEKHLIHLELMIMEQVQDWEYGVGRTEQPSRKSIILIVDRTRVASDFAALCRKKEAVSRCRAVSNRPCFEKDN